MPRRKADRQLAARVEMMPRDTEIHGQITGGTLLCHIDLAAATVARAACSNPGVNRMVTRAMDKVDFGQFVSAHDVLTCWGRVVSRGNTSVTVHIEVEADRGGKIIPVTKADAVFVALDEHGKPTPLCNGGKVSKRRKQKSMPPAEPSDQPQGERVLAVRKVMMPNELNGMGNIFGGQLLTYMDQAGLYVARRRCSNKVIQRLVTRFMDRVEFKQPVHVNDLLSCYGTVTKVGTTSVQVHVEVEVLRKGQTIPVTQCDLVYVAIDENRRPVPVLCNKTAKSRRSPGSDQSSEGCGCRR